MLHLLSNRAYALIAAFLLEVGDLDPPSLVPQNRVDRIRRLRPESRDPAQRAETQRRHLCQSIFRLRAELRRADFRLAGRRRARLHFRRYGIDVVQHLQRRRVLRDDVRARLLRVLQERLGRRELHLRQEVTLENAGRVLQPGRWGGLERVRPTFSVPTVSRRLMLK